jgi:hypothetical protein
MSEKRPRAPRELPLVASQVAPRLTRIPSLQEQLRAGLEARGVSSDFSDALARRLALRFRDREPGEIKAALDGIATAYALEARSHEDLDHHLRELRSLEHLMKGFVGELEKLDEALEVLAAYVRRMRTHTQQSLARRPTLH